MAPICGSYFREAAPLGYLFGSESRDAYLSRVLPEYSAFHYINQQTAAERRKFIFSLLAGERIIATENYFHDGGDLPGFLLAAIRDAKPEQIEQSLKKKTLPTCMVREDLLADFLNQQSHPGPSPAVA